MLELIASLFLAVGPGAEPPPADDAAALVWRDEVVVTATRRPRSPDEVPASVTVVTGGELDDSAAATLDDALRRVPGFSLFRRAGSRTAHPTTQGVSLRGIGPSGASRTLVLLDGVPVNDPFGGWIYWSRLPRAAIDRVEIVRGASSDLWGSSALGGVIQILTTKPDGRSFELRAEAGSRRERRAAVAAAGGGERLAGLVDARYFETAGYPVVREDQRGAIDVAAGTRHGAFYGKLRSALSGRAELALTGNFFTEERGNGTPLTDNDTRGGYLSAGVQLVTAAGSSWRLSATGYRQRFASRFSSQAEDRGSELPALDQFDVGSEAVRGDLEWTRDFGERHRLTGGAEIAWTDAATAEDFFFVGTADGGAFTRRRRAGGEQVLAGLFLQDELALSPRWLLTLAGRLELWETRSGFRREASLADGAALVDRTFASRRRTTLSPRIGLRWQAGPRIDVRGAVYRAFRAPTVNELYRPFRVRNDITAANAALEPETLAGAEVGAAYRGRRLEGRVTVYWNRLEDAVANLTLGPGPGLVGPCGFVPDGGLCRQRGNLERSRVAGIEAELRYRAGGAWEVTASSLATDAEVREARSQPELEGKRLAQVPDGEWVLAVEHTDPSRLGGRLQVRWVAEQFEDDLNRRPLADFLVVDLSLRRELPRGLELFLAAENLFDRGVEAGVSADGVVTVGAPRLIHGGLRLRLRP